MEMNSQNQDQDRYSWLCDHCKCLWAMVHCQLHNLGLCLPCDHRLHTVDITSAGHVRSFICDQCRSPNTVMRCIDNKTSLCALCWEIEKQKSDSQQAAVSLGSYSGCPTADEYLEILAVKSDTNNVEGYGNASPQRSSAQFPDVSLDINSSNLIGTQFACTSMDINNMIGSEYDYSSHLHVENTEGGTFSVQLDAHPNPSSLLTVGGNQYEMMPNFQNDQNLQTMPGSLSILPEESSSNTDNQDGVLSPTLQYQSPKRKESVGKYEAGGEKRM